MAEPKRKPTTEGSRGFDPDEFFEKNASVALEKSNLLGWIIDAFQLPKNDDYIYRATAEVTLAQVQTAINHGGANRLHAWYVDSNGTQLDPPSQIDIEAYISIFSSTTSTNKALITFEKNAKKNSIRAGVAQNLISKRTIPASITTQKSKAKHINPYFDVWAWSCKNLEWTGPDEQTANLKQSHHVLPVFYHHFGCVCPSYDSIEAIRQVTKGRIILDAGSGNGYWTYMLRRAGMNVCAVDNGDSVWRTMWINDTKETDASKFIRNCRGAADMVLLMVYPQVTSKFTVSVLKEYAGTTICVAGTQNANGFTAFKDETIDKYIAREKPKFKKVMQTPLPSFAGKDDALFIFEAGS